MQKAVWRSALFAAGLFFTACAGSEPEAPPGGETTDVVSAPLVITSPERATFLHLSPDLLTVKGTGGTKTLLVNGQRATVQDDGTWEAKIEPLQGLNLISAIDGDRKAEIPVIYGTYTAPDKWVASAVALDIGPSGFNAAAPAASLSTLATGAIEGQDLGASIAGTTQSGSAVGIDYSFTVTGATYDTILAKVDPAEGGPNVTVTIGGLVVNGTMTIEGDTDPVEVTTTEGVINGLVKFAVTPEGKLDATMPDATCTLNGFQFDSGNFLLDVAITALLKGEIEKQIAKTIKEQIPGALAGAFDNIALPKELDLSALGLTKPVPIQSKFDAAKFDPLGGTLSLTALFGEPLAPGSPGTKAPGVLALGSGFEVGKGRPASIGISLGLNALNQLLYAAWGAGNISFKAANMTLVPKLPPLAMMDENDELTLGLGEVLVTQEGQTQPMAAATIFQTLEGVAQDDKLMLQPKGETRLSITWLSGEPGPARELIEVAARSQLKNALKPVEIPIPKIALDSLSPSFAGQSLVVGNTKVTVAPSSARVSATGTMSIVK